MKNLTKVFFAVAMLLVVASCSKDKRQEKRLEHKDGKWNITSQKEDESVNGGATTSYSVTNPGTIVFNDNGTIVTTVTYSGTTTTSTGTWTTTADKLTIVINGETDVYAISDSSRKKITLTGTPQVSTSGSNTSTVTTTFTLEKA